MKRSYLLSLTLIFVLGLASISEANLIQNGDFSAAPNLEGWTATGSFQSATVDGVKGIDFLLDGSTLSQTFGTTKDSFYTLTFESNVDKIFFHFPFALLGVTVNPSDLSLPTQLISGLFDYSVTFKAESGSTTLAFVRPDGFLTGFLSNPFISNVDIEDASPVNPTPVPAAIYLFASGMLGLIGVQRRKIKKFFE